MKEWTEIAVGVASLVALFGSLVVAWMIAVRYRIPQLESRVKALEEINSGENGKLVRKSEIYKPDGRPIYMHREDCDRERDECGGSRSKEAEQMQAAVRVVIARLDAMEDKRAKAREQMIAFMSAVKEKLKLEFTIPEN